MKRAVTALLIGLVAFGLAAIMLFADARSNIAVTRDGIGLVTLVNAEWVALLMLAAVCGSTAVILAYLAAAIDVLSSPSTPSDSAAEKT